MAEMRARFTEPMRYIKKRDGDGYVFPWSEALSQKRDMVECDSKGNSIETRTVLIPDPAPSERDLLADKIVLDGLRKLHARGIVVDDDWCSGRWLPNVLKAHGLAGDFRPVELAPAIERLLQKGLIGRAQVPLNQ